VLLLVRYCSAVRQERSALLSTPEVPLLCPTSAVPRLRGPTCTHLSKLDVEAGRRVKTLSERARPLKKSNFRVAKSCVQQQWQGKDGAKVPRMSGGGIPNGPTA